MRLPRFRLTVRRLMAIVAAAAVAIAGYVWSEMSRLREGFRQGAAYHADEEQEQRAMLVAIAARRGELAGNPTIPLIERLAQLRADYHAEMGRKYRRAADRPWEPVTPDPGKPMDERLTVGSPQPGRPFTGPSPPLIAVSPGDGW